MSAGPESLLIDLFGRWLLPALLAGVVVTVGWLLITRLRPRRRPDTPKKETAMGESQRPGGARWWVWSQWDWADRIMMVVVGLVGCWLAAMLLGWRPPTTLAGPAALVVLAYAAFWTVRAGLQLRRHHQALNRSRAKLLALEDAGRTLEDLKRMFPNHPDH